MTDNMPEDPFADPVSADLDDPFASAEDLKAGSGVFVPWPAIEAIRDRLVVIVPRTFDSEAKVSEFLQKTYNLKPTREEWKTDLVVLDGGTLQYTYRAKRDGTENEYEEREHRIEALPALIPGWKVSWGNVIGSLNKIADSPKPFALGRLRAGYSIKEMRAGRTFEEFRAEQEAFYANPRGKKEPKAVWHLEASEAPADKAVALAWWKTARAEGFKA